MVRFITMSNPKIMKLSQNELDKLIEAVIRGEIKIADRTWSAIHKRHRQLLKSRFKVGRL